MSSSTPTRTPRRAGSRPAPTGTADLVSAAAPGWVLMPLRAFLGVTFIYAGLQKLADPNFFRSTAASSIQSQLNAAARSSPIGGLLGPVQHVAVVVGVVVALTELIVGIATLLGLWSRVGAAIGLLLAFGFLLAVSWHSRPYYLGPDIVFCFAWTPLLLAPPGPWSVDRWLGSRARFEEQLFETNLVGVAFGTVKEVCGHYDRGRCQVRAGAVCEPAPCPVLTTRRAVARRVDVDFERRELLARARLAGFVALPIVLAGGLTTAIGRALNHGTSRSSTPSLGRPGSSPSSASSLPTAQPGPAATGASESATSASPSTGSAPSTAAGIAIGSASTVPVGGAASFTDPTNGQAALVIQPRAGQFKAFSAICTHQGCTVDYSSSSNQFRCPCHGALFDGATGAVIQGPAQDPLPAINVSVRSGQVYVTG
jgi:thiosulfate dehydrogenase [quinone] large subunit